MTRSATPSPRYFAEHRCIPCGNGSWDELPDTIAYTPPTCCKKAMVQTGRIQSGGYMLLCVGHSTPHRSYCERWDGREWRRDEGQGGT